MMRNIFCNIAFWSLCSKWYISISLLPKGEWRERGWCGCSCWCLNYCRSSEWKYVLHLTSNCITVNFVLSLVGALDGWNAPHRCTLKHYFSVCVLCINLRPIIPFIPKSAHTVSHTHTHKHSVEMTIEINVSFSQHFIFIKNKTTYLQWF